MRVQRNERSLRTRLIQRRRLIQAHYYYFLKQTVSFLRIWNMSLNYVVLSAMPSTFKLQHSIQKSLMGDLKQG